MRLEARPSGPLRGRARPPGDKSISHRALLLGGLAAGETLIEGLLQSEDVLRTAAAVRALGARVTAESHGRWRVAGRGAAGFAEPANPLDFGNSGTGVRLAMGAVAGAPILAVFIGDDSLSRRPMARIATPLERMGATVLTREKGLLPAAVQGRARLKPIAHESAHASAQVKSAVLLAGLAAEGETAVIEPAPSRDHTERMLRAFGVDVAEETLADGRRRVALSGPARLAAASVSVPGDPSSGAFAAAAALITGAADLLIEDIGMNPLRYGFFETLREMGAQIGVLDEGVSGGEPFGLIQLRSPGGLKGVAPPAARTPAMIDEFPILAALAAFAEGETIIAGAEELRVKESDRIALTAAGLRACGVQVEERPDGLIIEGKGAGGVPGGAEIETHGDHRIAMSFLVLGLGAQAPVRVKEAEMIATSFPDFAGFMRALGADIVEV